MEIKILLFMFFIIISDTARGQDYWDLENEILKEAEMQSLMMKTSPLVMKASKQRRSGDERIREITKCDRNTARNIDQMGRKSLCQPRPTLVTLPEHSRYAYFTDTIVVNRCAGYCSASGQSCMRSEGKQKTVQFKARDITGNIVCLETEVDEHKSCSCGCDLMAKDCSDKQKYDADNCSCVCINDGKNKCTSSMFWNPKTCTCKCKMVDEDCSTGTVLVPSMCKCVVLPEKMRREI